LNLNKQAKIVGAMWFITGALYDAVISKGFRNAPAPINLDSQA
jgi:hypothetical protein